MSDELFSEAASPVTQPQAPTPGDDRAAAVRATAGRRRAPTTRPPGRAPTPKKTTTRKTAAPKTAPSKGKPAAETPGRKVAGFVKTGALFWASTRSPVKGAILVRQAETLGPVLDGIAAESKQAAYVIERLANIFSAGGAWGDAGMWVGQTVAAMTIASGALPGGIPGMLIAGMGGALVETALTDAAERAVNVNAPPDDATDDEWERWQQMRPELVAEARAQLVDQITIAAAARAGEPVDPEDEDAAEQ